MAKPSAPATSFSVGRKWGILLSVLLSMVSVIALVVMINYLASRYLHTFRFSLTTRATTQLSPQTLGLLKSITNHVSIIAYYDKEDDLYQSVDALLKDYHYACPDISVETVDFKLDAGTAEKVKERYGLTSAEDKNLVIFDCQGRVRIVSGKMLGSYKLEQVSDDQERKFRNRLVSFQGELEFSSALLSVIKPKALKACFLKWHGEHNPESETDTGYSKFAEVLKHSNVSIQLLGLGNTNSVPADCNLLVIAGPQKPLEAGEQEKIRQYLLQGGRLLVLFDSHSSQTDLGLESILAAWGVDVGRAQVVDKDHSRNAGDDIIVENFNRQHPLVNPLLDGTVQIFYPRSIGRLAAGRETRDAPKVEELAWTGQPVYLGGSQLPVGHQVPLMVAVEKGNVSGVFNERGTTRIVVVGDSIFLSNVAIDFADNRTFAVCAVNWLLDQNELLQGVMPRPTSEFRFVMTQSQMRRITWLFLAGMPGAILALGGLVWLRRRH
jgi:hypothetical protein